MLKQRAAPDSRRTLLFATRQRLLADCLSMLFTSDGTWSVQVVGVDHPDLLEICRAADPSVVVVDIDAEALPVTDLVANVVAGLPRAGVVVLGGTVETIAATISAGARACLTYQATPEEVLDSVEAAYAGRTVVDADDLAVMLRRMQQRTEPKTASSGLSRREVEILQALAAGRSPEEIAAALGIRVATVRKHIQNVFRKVGVHSMLQAAAYAARAGLG